MSMISGMVKDLTGRFMKLRREVTWIVIGQFLGFAGGFIGIKVLTNIMGPKGYGQLALGLTIAGLFNMYVYGPAANVVARFFVVYRERGELNVYFAVLRKSHRVIVIIVTVLTLLVSGVAGLFLGREWALIILLSSLYGVVSGINASYLSLQSAIRQRKIVALHQGADVWLRIGLSIVLLLVFSRSGYFSLLGYLLGTFIVTISQGIFALRTDEIRNSWQDQNVDAAAEKKSFREFSGYAASFMVFSGFASISMYADRWILQGLYGASVVGIYSAIYQIAASPVNIFFAMVNQLAVPIVFERAGAMKTAEQAKNSAMLVNQVVALSSLAMLMTAFVAFFFCEPLVRILTNKAFAVESNILWLTVVGLAVFNIAQLYSLKGMYCNMPKIYLGAKGAQAVSFVLIALLLARRIGIQGIAIGLCASSIVFLVIVLFVNNRIELEFE